MIVVTGDATVATVGDFTRLLSEPIPDRWSSPIKIGRTLDLKREVLVPMTKSDGNSRTLIVALSSDSRPRCGSRILKWN